MAPHPLPALLSRSTRVQPQTCPVLQLELKMTWDRVGENFTPEGKDMLKLCH